MNKATPVAEAVGVVGWLSGDLPDTFTDCFSGEEIPFCTAMSGCRVDSRAYAGARAHATRQPDNLPFSDDSSLETCPEKLSGAYPTTTRQPEGLPDNLAPVVGSPDYRICATKRDRCGHSRLPKRPGADGLLCCDDCAGLEHALLHGPRRMVEGTHCPTCRQPYSYRGKKGLPYCKQCMDALFPGDKRKGTKWKNY